MNNFFIFACFIIILVLLLLGINIALAPSNPYLEKNREFECGFHSFLGQNRVPFTISFFIFGLLFLLFDLEILLVYPFSVSGYINEPYGLTIVVIFLFVLGLGFCFELGKKALFIDSKQNINKVKNNTISIVQIINTDRKNIPFPNSKVREANLNGIFTIYIKLLKLFIYIAVLSAIIMITYYYVFTYIIDNIIVEYSAGLLTVGFLEIIIFETTLSENGGNSEFLPQKMTMGGNTEYKKTKPINSHIHYMDNGNGNNGNGNGNNGNGNNGNRDRYFANGNENGNLYHTNGDYGDYSYRNGDFFGKRNRRMENINHEISGMPDYNTNYRNNINILLDNLYLNHINNSTNYSSIWNNWNGYPGNNITIEKKPVRSTVAFFREWQPKWRSLNMSEDLANKVTAFHYQQETRRCNERFTDEKLFERINKNNTDLDKEIYNYERTVYDTSINNSSNFQHFKSKIALITLHQDTEKAINILRSRHHNN